MATKKDSTKTSTKTTKKANKVTAKPVDETKEISEVELLKQELAAMRAEMTNLISINKELASLKIQPQNQVIVKQEDSEVVIGCRVLQGIGWGDRSDPTGEIRLNFNEEQVVSVSDMKTFFRQHYIRELFEDGLCYFTNEEDYALFKIRNNIDLSDENLIRILSKQDVNDIMRDLDVLTNNKKNSKIINCIIFRICDMIRNQTIDLGYYTRKGVEGYFNMDFDRGIKTLIAIEAIRV